MNGVRPSPWDAWWALIHRAIAVGLLIALTVAPLTAHHVTDHGHPDQAAATLIDKSEHANVPTDPGHAQKCHVAGSCSVLGLPGTEYDVVMLARQRMSLISDALLWQSLDLPPAFRPPII